MNNVEKRKRTIATETARQHDEAAAKTATQLEEPMPMPMPAFHQQRLQSFLEPTPASTPPTATTQVAVDEAPIHSPGTALGSASDHWLKSLAFTPTYTHFGTNDYPTSLRQSLENNTYGLPQASVAMRNNDYRPSPTPFRNSVNDNVDYEASKLLLAYLPRNVSPEVLHSIARFHQDLADDLRMEAKRLEREMRQERERDWGR